MFSVSCACFISLHHKDGWKIFVARSESCNGVVFEGLNGLLCCIGAVVMWFVELHVVVGGQAL